MRLSWLVGGWLIGKLFVTSEGVSYRPNSWTKAVFRVPEIDLPWSEIAYAAAVDQPGPRDPGLLELRIVDGSDIAFMVTKNRKLEGVLQQFGHG